MTFVSRILIAVPGDRLFGLGRHLMAARLSLDFMIVTSFYAPARTAATGARWRP